MGIDLDRRKLLSAAVAGSAAALLPGLAGAAEGSTIRIGYQKSSLLRVWPAGRLRQAFSCGILVRRVIPLQQDGAMLAG